MSDPGHLLARALTASLLASLGTPWGFAQEAPTAGQVAPPLLTSPTSAQMPGVLDQALAEFDQAQDWLVSRPDRARQLFRLAAARLESIVAGGVNNGFLEYNLGNCYLQAGDIGRAILHFRRAERFIPRHPFLLDNLRVARSRCLTSVATTRAGTILRNAFFWHYQTSATGRLRFASWTFVAFWLVWILHSLTARKWLTGLAITMASLAMASGASAAISCWGERNAPQGVVLTMDVSVYKGPGAGYQRQFEQPLQAGTEFTLLQRRKGWWEIELPDGKRGWLEVSQAELIPPEN